jgi:hypothetical protein
LTLFTKADCSLLVGNTVESWEVSEDTCGRANSVTDDVLNIGHRKALSRKTSIRLQA